MRKIILLMLLVIVVLTLVSCAPGEQRFATEKPAGFFWGVWHGWIAPISLIVSLFNSTTRVYEVNNTGWWYDLGFYIAVISGFGSLSFSRKKWKKIS